MKKNTVIRFLYYLGLFSVPYNRIHMEKESIPEYYRIKNQIKVLTKIRIKKIESGNSGYSEKI